MTPDPVRDPGAWLAAHLDATWLPEPDQRPHDVCGHLRLSEDVYVYVGGGFGESGGAWLQIAYLFARPYPGAGEEDYSACGTGAGTRVIESLFAWSARTHLPVRFVSIENPGFFGRFAWDEQSFTDASGNDDCWHYPA